MGNGALPHGPSDRAHPRLYPTVDERWGRQIRPARHRPNPSGRDDDRCNIELMKLRGRAPRLVDPLRAMAIRDKPIAPGSPWQNSFAERLIAIRRECVDHIVVLGEAHLRQTLREYARYYNTARTHRSLDQD